MASCPDSSRQLLSWGSTCTLVGLLRQSLRTQDYPVTKKSLLAKLFLAKLFLSTNTKKCTAFTHKHLAEIAVCGKSIENLFYLKVKREWAGAQNKLLIELWATIFTKASVKFYRSNISAVVCDLLISTASCDLLDWLQGLLPSFLPSLIKTFSPFLIFITLVTFHTAFTIQ